MSATAEADDVAALAAVLEAGVVDLVRAAPDLPPADVEGAAQRALELALALIARGPAAAGLALAIERTLDGIADGKIAQGVGLPALAMAAYTLWRGVVEPAQVAPMDASRFELETLFPIAGRAAAPSVHVTLERLSPTLAAAGTAAMRARAQRLGALALADQLEADLDAVAAARGRYD